MLIYIGRYYIIVIGDGKMNDNQSSFPPRSEKHSSDNVKNNNDNNGNSFFDEFVSTVKYILVLSLVFFIVHRFFFTPVMVDGDSMEPTLSDGDYLLLNKFSDIDRFDVVVFPPPDNQDTQYIKRVIGMPGDTVEYDEDTLYLNGEPVDQPFLEEEGMVTDDSYFMTGDFTLPTLLGEEVVPEGHYFLLGDNRLNSRDSRSFGFIEEEAIIGEVSLRYWPLDEFGFVE